MAAFAISFTAISFVNGQQLVQYVQPLSGTASSTTSAAQKHSEAGSEKNANTIPAVCFPFGMTQFTPQTAATETKCIPPYAYKDKLLNGFRATHWISGSCMQDYGSFTVMPITGKLRTAANEYAIPFSHDNEISTPAYYKVDLPAAHITAELTASQRCGMMRFTAQQDDSVYLLITPNSDRGEGFAKVNVATGEVWSYNPVHRIYQGWGEAAGFSGYLYIKTDKKIAISGTFSEGQTFSIDSIKNRKNAGVYLGFKLNKGEAITLGIGTSFTSLKAAEQNREYELSKRNFDVTANNAKAVWEKTLGQIQVSTNDEKAKRIFYTALYHAFLHPRSYGDMLGTYPKFTQNYQTGNAGSSLYFDDFSMWDIYRAQLPLIEILQPEVVRTFVQSLITKGEQGGWLPIFPCWNNYTAAMIGDHATAFIASAYTKGIRYYDVEKAYALMRRNAFDAPNATDYKNGMGRRALTSYLKYGFIPLEDSVPEAFHKKEQVSRTLEYAYDDYALSVVAKALGKTADYQQLYQRSLNYKNVFDSSVGLVRGRYANGSWITPFNADKRESYITEGTPRQYTFYVPQDVAGLSNKMGGAKAMEKSLDNLFAKNEYWHGNEPGHQIPFMYNYTAAPWKTQQKVREILDEEYSDGPGGLSGNDDAGQMSAWYVFASMGFYPLDPVSGEYLLCTPLFDTVAINPLLNHHFQIVCHKTSRTAKYIQKVTVNGQPYNKNFITHQMVMDNKKIEMWLGDAPSTWGANASSRPSSLSDKK
jgi:predicted alpha-1,2-mannosidase